MAFAVGRCSRRRCGGRALGGLIGLGGAEFRFPHRRLRIPPLRAVILNKALSRRRDDRASGPGCGGTLGPSRRALDGGGEPARREPRGCLAGASWATRFRSRRSTASSPFCSSPSPPYSWGARERGALTPARPVRGLIGVFAGLGIGIVASLLGVAGGELLIPTLVLLYGADLKLAGSLSLLVSLPTMLVGFSRYSRDASFSVLGRIGAAAMALGSMLGSLGGGRLVGLVPDAVSCRRSLVLVVSAVRLWRHRDIGASRA